MKPLVSLVVAIYNVAPYLKQCIESIIKQTETNIEIILVDDGSSDESSTICDTYAKMYHNIRVIHQPNAGVSAARNAGILAATADWIVFVDGDDFLDQQFVEKMLLATEDDVDIVCCAYHAYKNGEILEKRFFKDEFLYKDLDEKKPLFYQLMQSRYGQEEQFRGTGIGVPWAKIYRASLIKMMTYNISLRRMQDNVFNMHAFYFSKGVKYINKCLYFYRLNNISTYRNVYYDPEIYVRVLRERDTFYERDALFSQSDFMQHRLQEKEEYLYRSCKNIVLTSEDFVSASSKMDELRNNNVFNDVLRNKYAPEAKSRRIVVSLWRNKRYRILYFGLGLYWKYKN